MKAGGVAIILFWLGPFRLASIACAIWSLFQPDIASYVFIVSLLLYELFIFSTLRRPREIAEGMTEHWYALEVDTLKRFYYCFRFPAGSAGLSITLSLVVILSAFWIAWMLWNHFWLQAILFLFNIPIAAHLAMQLRPIHFLEGSVKKGNPDALADLALFRRVWIRLNADATATTDELNSALTADCKTGLHCWTGDFLKLKKWADNPASDHRECLYCGCRQYRFGNSWTDFTHEDLDDDYKDSDDENRVGEDRYGDETKWQS